MHYGTRAKDWITDHDIKQKTLAKEFHVTESMMSHYLTGRNEITVDVLVKFAKYFNLSLDYLVGLTDIPERQPSMSKDEQQLIEGFRTLSQKQKELILQNICFMQQQNQRQ